MIPRYTPGIANRLAIAPTIIEKRVSPAARMRAMPSIAYPFEGSVNMCSAIGPQASVASAGESVISAAMGQPAAATPAPMMLERRTP